MTQIYVLKADAIKRTEVGNSGADLVHISPISGVESSPGIAAATVQEALKIISGRSAPGAATPTQAGILKTSVAPVDPANPIAVEDADPRNTNARTPTAHGHPATAIAYAGSVNLSAADVEAALDELDAEKSPTGHGHTAQEVGAIGEVYDEGVALAYSRALDFLGEGVIVTRNTTTGRIEVTISGAAAGAASETAAGITEQATEAEVQAGTAGNLFATVARLKAELDRRFTSEAWTAPALLNGWVNFGTPYEVAGYKKDRQGVLWGKGVIKSGSTTAGTVLYNLPAGYRPSADRVFAASAGGTFSRIVITSTGDVVLYNASNNAQQSVEFSFLP